MADPALVDQVHQLADALRSILVLMPADDPLHREDDKKDVPSFLFEMRVLAELLDALRSQFAVSCVRRGRYVVFARAPAKKANKSYVVLSNETGTYHLCIGTKHPDRYGSEQAPDLSLQRVILRPRRELDAPENQKDEEAGILIAIWDAKLRGESSAPSNDELTKPEVAEFIYMLDALQLVGRLPPDLEGWPPAFEVSSLITNGRSSAHPSLVFFEKSFSETPGFVDATTPCRPNRNEHRLHADASSFADRRHGAVSRPK